MTADQSLFTELLPDKQKAAKGTAVKKGSGNDGNEKDPFFVIVPDKMKVSKLFCRNGKSSLKSEREKNEL